MPLHRRHGLAAALLLVASPAIRAVHAEEVSYAAASEVDLLVLLPPPPVEGSPADQAEMQAVLAAQRDRSPEQAARAVADAEETPVAILGGLLGERFSAERTPRAHALFARLGETEEVVTAPAKRGFGRRRPHLVNAQVRPIVPLSSSGAYPSGHTTRGTMECIALVAMLPERRAEIMARAEEYGQSRLFGGIHYPADLVAGHLAGTATMAVLLNKAEFRTDLAAARTELRAALGL